MTSGSSARIAWFATSGAQTPRDRPAPPVALEPVRTVVVGADGQFEIGFELPMPSMSLIELVPS